MSFFEINEDTQSINMLMSRFIYCKNIVISIINTFFGQDIYNTLIF